MSQILKVSEVMIITPEKRVVNTLDAAVVSRIAHLEQEGTLFGKITTAAKVAVKDCPKGTIAAQYTAILAAYKFPELGKLAEKATIAKKATHAGIVAARQYVKTAFAASVLCALDPKYAGKSGAAGGLTAATAVKSAAQELRALHGLASSNAKKKPAATIVGADWFAALPTIVGVEETRVELFRVLADLGFTMKRKGAKVDMTKSTGIDLSAQISALAGIVKRDTEARV